MPSQKIEIDADACDGIVVAGLKLTAQDLLDEIQRSASNFGKNPKAAHELGNFRDALAYRDAIRLVLKYFGHTISES